jgi:hypothetical protein
MVNARRERSAPDTRAQPEARRINIFFPLPSLPYGRYVRDFYSVRTLTTDGLTNSVNGHIVSAFFHSRATNRNEPESRPAAARGGTFAGITENEQLRLTFRLILLNLCDNDEITIVPRTCNALDPQLPEAVVQRDAANHIRRAFSDN